MNYLETILNFLTRLARIIFPRKQKPAVGECDCPCDCPCPHPFPDAGHGPAPNAGNSPVPNTAHSPVPNPLPAPLDPPLPPDAGNGSNPDLHRSDPLALTQGNRSTPQRPEADWLGMSGYYLMVIGGAGCLYKWVVG